MALRQLLQTGAVLDLCGGDVVLPSEAPLLEGALNGDGPGGSQPARSRQHTKSLRSRLASGGIEPDADAVAALVLDPKKAAKAGSCRRGSDYASEKLRNSPTLAALTESLAVCVTLLQRWAEENRGGAAKRVADTFEGCLQRAKAMPRPRVKEELPSLLDPASKEIETALLQKINHFLADFLIEVRAMTPGGMLVVPAGWLRSYASETGAGIDGGHCLLLVLLRGSDSKADEYTMVVVNTGEGLEYHPVRAAGKAPSPEKPVRQAALFIVGIPRQRVTSSAFWVLMCRQITHPHVSNGPEMFYGTLLPFLNQRPLSENFNAEPKGWVQFLPVPISGDGSCAICIQRAVHICCLAAGMPKEEALWTGVRLRSGLLGSVQEALSITAPGRASAGELALVGVITASLARACAQYIDTCGEENHRSELESIKKAISEVDSRVKNLDLEAGSRREVHSPMPSPCPPEEIAAAPQGKTAPVADTYFDRFDRIVAQDVEHLKGPVEPSQILIHAPLSKMPLSLRDPFEAAECCRLASNLLTLLANQQEKFPQSALSRFALITHLMMRILPMPLPIDHRDKRTLCFWMQDMKYETKADLMRHICLISRHFAAVCFTLRPSRETDGARVVVAAALAAVMDALMRRPLGGPLHGSLLSLHYSGEAEGPTRPFGLDFDAYREAAEALLLVDPEQHALRCLTLDYFHSVHRRLDSNHVLLQFDQSMGCSSGDRAFMDQLGLSIGVDDAARQAPLLLTGERPDLLELFQELAWFRDVVFLWKMLLLPSSAVPEPRPWRATDAVLNWHWDGQQFLVRGFGRSLSTSQPRKSSGMLTGMMQWLYRSEDKAVSAASASVLAGSAVKSEDDVLFLQHVPSFNGMLKPAESELLLSYLTAPYLRVPLLLGFFATRDHISLLREPQLQMVLDAALFEAGAWQPPSVRPAGPPKTVPASDRGHLSTPCGLLFNELLRTPKVVLEPIITMVRLAVEKDTGRPGSGNEGLILYLVRLAVRVDNFLEFMVQHARRGSYLERSGAGYEARVRSMPSQSADPVVSQLESSQASLRRELQEDVWRMLHGWARFAMRKRDELAQTACRVHAHLALICKNMLNQQLTVRDVSTFLSSHIFINTNHRWSRHDRVDAKPSSLSELHPLGVREVELFDMFEAKRSMLVMWLRENPDSANSVLNKVEQVVSLREQPRGQEKGPEAGAAEWCENPLQPGDFILALEMLSKAWAAPRKDETFRNWLERITRGASSGAAQVSVNHALYGNKQEGLELLPDWVADSVDYQEAYGNAEAHCTNRETATKRVWKELVGHNHSVQRWTQDDRGLEADVHASKWLSGRVYNPAALQPDEAWVASILEPMRLAVPQLAALELRFQADATSRSQAWLGTAYRPAQGGSHAGHSDRPAVAQLKEVRVQRWPPLVELYDVLEYGRQHYRALAFASDATWSFCTPSTHEALVYNANAGVWSLSAGRLDAVYPSTQSVIILRQHSAKQGRQTYMPRRFLHGLLPEALLERYRFWRSVASSPTVLVGDEVEPGDTPTRLLVYIDSVSGRGVVASVERRVLVAPKSSGLAEPVPIALWSEDPARRPELLVNLQGETSGGLAVLLARLENLSHVLAWTVEAGRGGIVRVEMPRLRLSFAQRGDKLLCEQHSGFWLMTRPCSETVGRLVSQWGGGTALLENVAGEVLVLISAVAEPIRPAVDMVGCFLPTQLVFRRGQDAWVSNLAEGSRHYYYPIHLSGAFVFAPTAASNLYLLLCRFLTWHFKEIPTMAGTISELCTREETQLWDRFSILSQDHHADAVACRLRLLLTTVPFGTTMASSRMDIRRLLLEYVRKRSLVSADCALSCEQELQLMDLPGTNKWYLDKDPELVSRRRVLKQLLSLPSAEEEAPVNVELGMLAPDAGFDRVDDTTFANDVGLLQRITSTLHDVSYTRPEKPLMKGLESMRFIDSIFSDFGIASPVAPFPLLYELFTETVRADLLDEDDSGMLASLLLRATGRDGQRGGEWSVLRALDLNQKACKEMPQWGSSDLKWNFSIGSFKFDKDSTAKLLKAAGDKLKAMRPNLTCSRGFRPPPVAPSSVLLRGLRANHNVFWAPPVTDDVSCSTRRFGAQRGEEFGSEPLAKLSKAYVHLPKDTKPLGMTAGGNAVKGLLEQAATGTDQSSTRTRGFRRLLQSLKDAADGRKTRPHLGPVQKLDKVVVDLSKELAGQRTADAKAVETNIASVVSLAARGSLGDWMRRRGGRLPELGFSACVALLMANEPQASESLQRIAPALTLQDCEKFFEDIAIVLCRTIRIGQASRAQSAIDELQMEKQRQASDVILSLKAEAVAGHLSSSRHFTKACKEGGGQRSGGGGTGSIDYDPRMLVFEFLFNLMLRQSQVELVRTFFSSASKGNSVCHQMLMGQGKTTVIAPLLTLLLADGKALVCACMPPALLEMSRGVMVERFSSPVLQKPVITLSFHRHTSASAILRGKLDAARHARAVIVAAPVSVKSILLRQMELLHELEDDRTSQGRSSGASAMSDAVQAVRETRPSWFAVPSWLGNLGIGRSGTLSRDVPKKLSKEEVKAKSEEVLLCNEILAMFHGGIMLLDEVDLLLDPLRSELNWPLGRRVPLDLTEGEEGPRSKEQSGFRYRLPFHLIDGIFAASLGQPPVDYHGRREAEVVLGSLAQKISVGKQTMKLQATPHLIVLSKEFYNSEMLPLLVQWLAIFLQPHVGTLNEVELRSALAIPHMTDANLTAKLQNASATARKLVNLAVTWLHFHLPHVLSKVHRVSYGLLTGDLLNAALRDGCMSPSRRLLAVPFVGKDAPSHSSEFSHPDMAIGFTIMAYRLAGLRDGDAQVLLRVLVDEMKLEASVKFHRRSACKAYVGMIIRGGGTVRGFTEDGRWIADLKEEEQRRRTDAAAAATALGEEADGQAAARNVWPLEMLDLGDPEQVGTVVDILRHSALAVQYFLERHAFAPGVGALDHNEAQLTASAQELAGRQLFGRCLGFSGTPNDLLPKSMGTCLYAAREDGEMLLALSSCDVVSLRTVQSWSPTSLLDEVATARADSGPGAGPKYHALIDTGALITGMSNFEVAEYLLRHGLEGLEGVVFLNDKDERIVLERDGFKTVRLTQCGLRPEQRFTFYDHVHTTGMDVPQPLTCVACLTLGKDMSFRDYAQGAYRMRGIGLGQRIEVLLTPEVSALVHKAIAKVEGITESARAKKLETLGKKPQALTQQLVVDIMMWLFLNGARAEEKRQQLLCQQNLHNVWRQAASEWCETCSGDITMWLKQERSQACMTALQNTVDFNIPEAPPGESQESFSDKLKRELKQYCETGGAAATAPSIWKDPTSQAAAKTAGEQILSELLLQQVLDAGDDGEGPLELNAEQVREQEQEEEQEREQQQENEQEVELEEEVEAAVEAPVERKYMRDAEAARPWVLQSLLAPPRSAEDPPFFSLAEFAVNRGIMGQSCNPLSGIPGFVMLSDNYYRRSWRLTSVRRLRNVICFLEYVPAVEKLRRLQAGAALSAEQRTRLKEAFELYDTSRSGKIAAADLRMLFRAFDLDAEGDAAVAGGASAKTWTLPQVEKEISSQAFCKMQDGRFFVALSLEEAEHLRASMHLLGGDNWPGGCGLALRSLRGCEAMPEDTLIDSYGPVLTTSESSYQLEVAEQLLRFTDSCADFQSRELNILLRCLQQTPLKDRLSWWLDVRSCRRRAQKPWQQLSVAKVFVSADEFEALPTKALLSRTRWTLATQRLWPVDAFRAMNKSGSGTLKEAELSSGLDSLGLRRAGVSPEYWSKQIAALLRLLDKDGNGVVDLEEFRTAMELDDADWESVAQPRSIAGPVVAGKQGRSQGAEQSAKTLPARLNGAVPAPPPAPATSPQEESLALITSMPKAGPVRLSPALCTRQQHGRFKVKWQTHTSFAPVWTTTGSLEERPLSIWAPSDLVPRGRFRGPKKGSNAVKERVPLGHYACSFFGVPNSVSLLEVTDEHRTGLFTRHRREALRMVMALFFPNPLRFHKLWCDEASSSPGKQLHLWEPVPPSSDYVALGVLATTEDIEPSPLQLRCVPRVWAERLPFERLAQVWSGGSGSRAVAVWSEASSGHLFRAASGAAASSGLPPEVYTFNGSETFYTETPPGI